MLSNLWKDLSYLVFPSALSLYDGPGKGIACLEVLERILQLEVFPRFTEEAPQRNPVLAVVGAIDCYTYRAGIRIEKMLQASQ